MPELVRVRVPNVVVVVFLRNITATALGADTEISLFSLVINPFVEAARFTVANSALQVGTNFVKIFSLFNDVTDAFKFFLGFIGHRALIKRHFSLIALAWDAIAFFLSG